MSQFSTGQTITDQPGGLLGIYGAGGGAGHVPPGAGGLQPADGFTGISGYYLLASGFFWIEPDSMEIFVDVPEGLTVERI